jgi:anti-sigma factor RsiW
MPNCQTIDPLVTSYVDDELPDVDRELVDHHLRECRPCHARVLAERAVHDLIQARRKALCRPCAPPSLHTRCAGHADNARPGQPAASPTRDVGAFTVPAAIGARTEAPRSAAGARAGRWAPAALFRAGRSRVAPLAVAASLVLLVGTAFLYQLTASSNSVMAAELAADHVKCFALNSGIQTHQAAAAAESALLSGFGWRTHLPSLAPADDLELVGARPCLYGEGKVAHIMYRHHGEPVSLYMVPHVSRGPEYTGNGTQCEVVNVLGHRAAMWCDGQRTFVLVGRQPQEEVERMASLVQASLK